MAVHNIIPNTNVSFNDIRDTLNANGGSVTNDFITAFQERAKINKWSKHKPVQFTDDFCQDFDPAKLNYKPGWWKGTDGNCGFTIPISGSVENIKNKDWSYSMPTSRYRLGDFCNYYPKAEPFIKHSYKDSLTINKGVILNSYTFSFQVNDPDSSYELSPNSFANGDLLRRSYISVFIYNNNFNLKVSAKDYFVNADSSADAASIEIPAINLVTGTFTCMFFLSTYKYVAGGPDGADTCMPFPSSPNSPNTISLSVTQTSALGIEWKEMSYAKTGPYKTIVEIEPQGGIGDYAWAFKSYGNIWAKVNLIGRTGTTTIGVSDLSLETMTFHATEEVTIGIMYDENLNRITSPILLNSGQTKTIYLEFANALIMKKGNPTIPSQGAPGYNSPIEIFSDIRFNGMSTSGHAFYYGQYATYNQWSWEIIRDMN